MPAASHRDEHLIGGSNLHGLPDICIVGTTSDRSRPAINHPIVDFARRAVLVIAWDDDATAQAASRRSTRCSICSPLLGEGSCNPSAEPRAKVYSLIARVGGEREEERCSFPDHAGYPDATAVRFDDALCDG